MSPMAEFILIFFVGWMVGYLACAVLTFAVLLAVKKEEKRGSTEKHLDDVIYCPDPDKHGSFIEIARVV